MTAVDGSAAFWAADSGHTRSSSSTWAQRVFWAPILWLRAAILCVRRPDVITSKTRKQEWAALQSEWRFVQAVFFFLGPPSHILWRIKWPLLVNMFIAGLITIDQTNKYHGLPEVLLTPDTIVLNTWRLISFVLSLLMAFRINRTYERWWLARQSFACVGNAGLTLSQQAMLWVADPAICLEVMRWSKLWHFAILQVLQGEKAIHPDAAAWMTEKELQWYLGSRKGRNLVVMQLRRLIALAGLQPVERQEMERTLQAGVAAAGACTRMRFQALPYSVTLVCSGFLQIFLMFLPCAVISSSAESGDAGNDSDHPAFGLVIYFFCCVLMLGVDEVACQLEQPYPFMPLKDIVDTTVRDIDRIPQEHVAGAGLQDAALQQQRAQLEAARMASLAGSGSLAAAECHHHHQQQQQQDVPRDGHDVPVVIATC